MTFEYYRDTDTLHVAVRPGPSADAAEVAEGVVLDYDSSGNVIGVTLEHASARVDLSSVTVTHIPAVTRAA